MARLATLNLPSPRYILVHSDNSALVAEQMDNRAHAFGPFDDYDSLVAFDKEMPDDECYRFALPLVGPEVPDVMIATIGMTFGARAAALSLPPRGDTPDERDAPSLDETMQALRKKMRKDAKRAAKAAARQAEIDKANAQDDGR